MSSLVHFFSYISSFLLSKLFDIMAEEKAQTFDIPKTCKAGVVVNEGPDFYVEVQDIEVPEIGIYTFWTCF